MREFLFGVCCFPSLYLCHPTPHTYLLICHADTLWAISVCSPTLFSIAQKEQLYKKRHFQHSVRWLGMQLPLTTGAVCLIPYMPHWKFCSLCQRLYNAAFLDVLCAMGNSTQIKCNWHYFNGPRKLSNKKTSENSTLHIFFLKNTVYLLLWITCLYSKTVQFQTGCGGEIHFLWYISNEIEISICCLFILHTYIQYICNICCGL